MAGIFGGGVKRQKPTVATGPTLQNSAYGLPIPLIYGKTRTGVNVIWYGNFQSSSGGSNSGKGGVVGGGGGGKGGGGAQTSYSASIALALGEGPINAVDNVYIDKNVSSLSTLGYSLFTGAYGQAPWGYLQTNFGPITEPHVIPSSGPYTITVADASAFIGDDGTVSGSKTLVNPTDYTQVYTPPADSQGAGSVAYTFNSAFAGQGVQITVNTNYVGQQIFNQVVPASGPYVVTIGGLIGFNSTVAIIAPNIKFTAVGGAPSVNQYSVNAGIYTFNSGNAGVAVTIAYVASDQVPPFQALPYSGIAYVAAANYSLGTSPDLPNHNFEVEGILHGSVSGQDDADPSAVVIDYLTNPFYGLGYPANSIGDLTQAGETFTIPGSPYHVTVAHAAKFNRNLDVVDNSGNIYTCVASSPGARQYTFSAGVYTFNSANSGATITINYAWLDGLTRFQNYTLALGLLISPAYTARSAASSVLEDLAKNLNCEWVDSSGILTLVPYGDSAVTGNGKTYTPPLTTCWDFTDADYLQNTAAGSGGATNADPVLMTRKRPSDITNSIKLEYLDRTNNYNIGGPAEAKNEAYINLYGLRQDSSRVAHMFTTAAPAVMSAYLQLQREIIANTFQWTTDQRFVFLDPMDIVSITTTIGSFPLNQQLVRITEITENDDNSFTFAAEEYLPGTGFSPAHSSQSGQGYSVNFNSDPGLPSAPIIFEPPPAIADNQGLEIWIGAAGGNNYGGSDIWVSSDGNSYRRAGRLMGRSRLGVTTADFATGVDPDVTHTLSVDLTQSNSILDSAQQLDADLNHTLCYISGYATPPAPMLSYIAGGTLAQDTYYIKASYVYSSGEGPTSPEESILVPLHNLLVVDSPPEQPGAIGWNLYSSDTLGNESKQNSTTLAIGTNFTLPTSGLVSGSAPAPSETGYELVSYETATLTALNKYNLVSYLRRGQYGSTITDHPAGAKFMRLDDTLLKIPYDKSQIGQAIYVKLIPFNIYGGGFYDISQVQPYLHTIEGPPPPSAVQNFSAQQTGNSVSFTWTDLIPYTLKGYDLLYSRRGGGLGTASLLTEASRATEMTNASVPPGDWTFYIRARDIADQVGPVSTFDLVVVNANNIIQATSSAPDWLGTLSGFLRHCTGVLTPDSTKAANLHTNAELFTQYVPYPVSNPTYTTGILDTGFDSLVRVWSTISASIRSDEPIIDFPDTTFLLDYWKSGGIDSGVYIPWTIGTLNAEFFKGRLQENTASGPAYIQDFKVNIDGVTSTQGANGVTIALGGTAISFSPQFHNTPIIGVTPIGSGVTATALTPTATGFIAHVYNSNTFADVGGVINWDATGT